MGRHSKRRLRTLLRWSPALFIVAQSSVCLPDNGLRTVLAQNLTQSFGLGFSGLTQLILGFPDLILNTIATNFLFQLVGT